MPERKTTVLIADEDLQLLDLVTLHLELEGDGVYLLALQPEEQGTP